MICLFASLLTSCVRAALGFLWFWLVSRESIFSNLGIPKKSSVLVLWMIPVWLSFDLANLYWILRYDPSFQRALFEANLLGGFVYMVFNCTMLALLESWTASFALLDLAFGMLSNVLLVALHFYLRAFMMGLPIV
ncbi:DUF2177 family protein [Candidatus Similichlamydia epinepheli]|uniref:DUF2177 family protein n=1 Tax=Candidatus Similichlamydia epinepheli TaxID=1903953 RepID=UPI000D3A8F2D|nr:DUF2177 family protein [Candidatus Similichlamydia epinepheli]